MSSARKAARAAAAAALAGTAPFNAMQRADWGAAIEEGALPDYAIGTPREQVQRSAVSAQTRAVDLVVLIRRAGGVDLEDLLDDDADAAEAALVSPLFDGFGDAELVQTETDIPGSGARRIGVIALTFRVTTLARETV